MTTLAVSPDDAVVAGTDTPGQVLTLDAQGKAFVLLDTPYREDPRTALRARRAACSSPP